MALIIVIPIEYVGMYCYCLSVKEKVESGLLGKKIFIITISSVMTVFDAAPGKFVTGDPDLKR